MRQTRYFPVQGGEDLKTPPLTINPGRMIYSKNYECDMNGRPRRIDGFERFSGKPAPSAASYWIINFDAGTAEITAGQTVTGATSAATGIAVYDGTVESGSYAGNDADGYLILTQVSGTFQDDENLQVAAATKCVADGTASERGASTDEDDATYIQAAIEYARTQIAVVTGSGDILGGFVLNDKCYTFRNNAGGTAAVLYVQSATGFTAVDLGLKLAFTSGGTTEIAEQDTITGATSGATATVERVVVESGTWGAGTAAGYFVLSGQTGTFQSENIDVGASSNLATIAGDSAAITLLPSGTYETFAHNFFGQAGSLRIYGCDGVNTGFEFDGTVFCPISTGATTDTPIHVRVFKEHLFFQFPGGSVIHSGTGYPLKWDAASGAAEIVLSDVGTGMEVLQGGVLAMWCRNSTHLLYGNDSTDWVKKDFSTESGAIEWSIQRMGQMMFLDDYGVTTLAAVQEFGDFGSRTVSEAVRPVIDDKKTLTDLTVQSIRVKAKNQYRLFYSDNTGLCFTFSGKKLLGITRLDYGMPVKCTWTGEVSGVEKLFFGSTDGYVYQLDSGTSFDGSAVEAIGRLPFGHLGSPENYKRFYKAVLEVSGTATITWVDEYDYGETAGAEISLDISAGGGYWDIDSWNEFLWSPTSGGYSGIAELESSGKNLGILLRSSQTYANPHTVQGIILHFEVHGLNYE